jgi:hypothetical protein
VRSEEKHFALSTQPTANLVREHGLDVQAIAVERGHAGAQDAEIRMAIDFFREMN